MTERDRERGDGRDPLDEEAAWAEIVAGFGETPADPAPPDPEAGKPPVWHPDAVPDRGDRPARGGAAEREAAEREAAERDAAESDGAEPAGAGPDGAADAPAGSVNEAADGADGAVAAPDGSSPEGAAAEGTAAEAVVNRLDENGQWEGPGPRDWAPEDDDDEGHFIPPEPPPLPESDLITRFAWIAVIGGPLLLVACAIFDIDVTWWIATAGVGGFLGGFATLVLGMRDGRDDEWTDPGSGAVV